ncbi:hypothetical protein LTR37_001332 [Vermiconidia calcicola]|uniref:Uncharacterized protein n=1 Tax=Vermiconidia calcicola TaxID=1690605 RepID=A0ACC3NXZ5_9PEZI|nr:hypothetical protein LTR37_001332 [Vermiconidia calcicola]
MQHSPIAQLLPTTVAVHNADSTFHNKGLREQLLAAGASGAGPSPYPQSSAPQAAQDNPYPQSDSASPHEQYESNSGAQPPYGMSGDSAGDDGLSPDARNKGKRELSTSKRAAQNRAAQRAFRQRKEGYIKKLEEQVKDFQTMEQNFRALQNENYQLREYILNLQSRLLENQSDFPPAPSHINLPSGARVHATPAGAADSGSAVEQQLRQEMRHDGSHDAMRHLQAAAAQANDARPHEPPYGLGRPRADEPDSGSHDAKPSS